MPNTPAGTVIGLMSGTSCDGVDAALVDITGVSPPNLRVKVRGYLTHPYNPALRERLLSLNGVNTARVDEVCRCNFLLGEALAQAASAVCGESNVALEHVVLVGSHGHTIHHLPRMSEGEIGTPSTLQIGNPAVICERTGITTVSDFRSRDMASGGEGAPLVPLVDYFLFSHSRELRIVLNIGGIANFTVLPPDGHPEQVLAFDTGPGNMVMDALATALIQKDADYDGRLAAQGQPNQPLLLELLQHPFYAVPPPKSTGRETFGSQYAHVLIDEARRRRISPADLMATATALTAKSIKDQIDRYVTPVLGKPARVIVSGGGAHNPVLMQYFCAELEEIPVETSDSHAVPVDAKEAVAFAILAWQTWWQQPGNLPSATGASKATVLGNLTPGREWPPPAW